MRLDELTLNPANWAKELLGYLSDLRAKKKLEKEKADLSVLIKMLDQGSSAEAVARAAEKRGIKLSKALK